ncbi:Aft2p NDAI_0F01660 [Naumovozyma dairenensis CBS 421]|uniref:Uncharacterized protein n=1 Tax=Naumovozyma dairenensis (strain ATCC 10597 / BCRC 20456 / CBS 421 / NBRC 0211 / NRRL Y-12639) TaxID=1071378 RepID=G0WCH4_NAUDC|nr:hypothetical protein NDAI_0F01660 [Naumovozyma dairenensis CBS 421]CCD25485.1 hypothetical protein NDAI_0F01660 [Naumovozyma dairenensis CBS 421]
MNGSNIQLEQDFQDFKSLFKQENTNNDNRFDLLDLNSIMTPPISPSTKNSNNNSNNNSNSNSVNGNKEANVNDNTTAKNIVQLPKKKKKTYNTNKNKPKSYSTPNNLSSALLKDQNKLIHLDPVPNFNDKSEIKPWLQKIFFLQGIDIVIERSDSGKVIFKCKSQTPKRRYAKSLNHNATAATTTTATTPLSSSSCPFRIRATFSLKLKKWNIVVVNNSHSHELKFNPNSDEYKKFKDYLKTTNDVETLKRFEELEYRSKLNLPINPSIIPCDCGLTSEVQSFNIILPTSKICGATKVQKINHNNNSNNSNSNLIDSIKNKNKKLKNFNKQNLLKKTTNQNLLLSSSNTSVGTSGNSTLTSTSTSPASPPSYKDSSLSLSLGSNFLDISNDLFSQPILTPDFMQDLTNNTNTINYQNAFDPQMNNKQNSTNSTDVKTDLFEIDFTDIFNKTNMTSTNNNNRGDFKYIKSNNQNKNDNIINYLNDPNLIENSSALLFSPLPDEIDYTSNNLFLPSVTPFSSDTKRIPSPNNNNNNSTTTTNLADTNIFVGSSTDDLNNQWHFDSNLNLASIDNEQTEYDFTDFLK